MNNFTVIIPSSRSDKVIDLLKSIEKNDLKGVKEIVIVANYNFEPPYSKVKTKVLIFSKRSVSLARNRGAKSSKTKWLCFIDDDVILPKNYFSKLCHKKLVKDAYSPIIKSKNKSKAGYLEWQIDKNSFKKYILNKTNLLTLFGMNIVIKRSVFEKVGGFDENYDFCEDRHLGFKLIKNGYKIGLLNNMFVYHQYPENILKCIRRKWRHGKGMVKLYKTNYEVYKRPLNYWFKQWMDILHSMRNPDFVDFIYQILMTFVYQFSVLYHSIRQRLFTCNIN